MLHIHLRPTHCSFQVHCSCCMLLARETYEYRWKQRTNWDWWGSTRIDGNGHDWWNLNETHPKMDTQKWTQRYEIALGMCKGIKPLQGWNTCYLPCVKRHNKNMRTMLNRKQHPERLQINLHTTTATTATAESVPRRGHDNHDAHFATPSMPR